jgi:hypothetical protein
MKMPADAERLRRVRESLLIKLGSSPLSATVAAVKHLKERGASDAKQCSEKRLSALGESIAACWTACSPDCPESGQCRVCTDKYEPESCRQIEICTDLSRLPF